MGAVTHHRAFLDGTLKFASGDDAGYRLEGVATTPTPDRAGDVVDPLGASYALRIPLLWQHDHAQPVGAAMLGEATAAGIPFSAELARDVPPGPLKDRIEEARASIRAGLVRGVSIGFRALEREPLAKGGWRFTRIEILELSLVTVPANAEATITAVKAVPVPEVVSAAPPADELDGRWSAISRCGDLVVTFADLLDVLETVIAPATRAAMADGKAALAARIDDIERRLAAMERK